MTDPTDEDVVRLAIADARSAAARGLIIGVRADYYDDADLRLDRLAARLAQAEQEWGGWAEDYRKLHILTSKAQTRVTELEGALAEAVTALKVLSEWSLPRFDAANPQSEGEQMRLWAIRWLMGHGAPDAALHPTKDEPSGAIGLYPPRFDPPYGVDVQDVHPTKDACPTCGSTDRHDPVSYDADLNAYEADCGDEWHEYVEAHPKDEPPKGKPSCTHGFYMDSGCPYCGRTVGHPTKDEP